MRFALLALALAFAAVAWPASAATTLVFEGPALLQFDGLYYPMSAGTLSVGSNTFTTAAPVAMLDCLRASGLAQTASAVQFRYGIGASQVIFLDETPTNGQVPPATLRWEAGMPVVRMTSRTGDLRCAGSVVPAGLDAMFSAGFE